MLQLLDRIQELDLFLVDPRLRGDFGCLNNLPLKPAAHSCLISMIGDPKFDNDEILQLARSDIGLTVQVLKFVNSVGFGLLRQVKTIEDAVIYLGYNNLRSIVLCRHLFEDIVPVVAKVINVERLWEHSLAVACVAESLVCNDPLAKAYASIGGLLHDVGKIIMADYAPGHYQEVLTRLTDSNFDCCQSEKMVYGLDHCEVGGYLTQLWDLPFAVVEAVALHQRTPHRYWGGVSAVPACVWHANRIVSGDFSCSLSQWKSIKDNPRIANLVQVDTY